jgi:hypothetical protein
MKLPFEAGCSWAKAPAVLKIKGYNEFSGAKYK